MQMQCRRKAVMTMNDNKKEYDCMTCPYPRYRDGQVIFCDVCIRRIMDERNDKKQGKDGDADER